MTTTRRKFLRSGPILVAGFPAIVGASGFSDSLAFRGQGPASNLCGQPWITGQNLITDRNNFTGDVGCVFIVNQNLTICALGRWVKSGNTQAHTVKLFDHTYALLGSVSVATAGAPVGYKYTDLGSPISLTAGPNGYFLESSEVSGGDHWWDGDTQITSETNDAGLIGSAVGSSNSINGLCYVPVNFLYTKP